VTVRVKIFLILAVMSTAMLGALYLAADYVILNRFIALERLNTQETMNVVREGFNDDLEKLDRSNSDLSVYDGTWRRWQRRTPQRRRSSSTRCWRTAKAGGRRSR
jgi:sensor domain CHASE-containing protein